MRLSQFIGKQIQESHVESSDLMQELKGYQKELNEILLKLSEHGQFGQKVAKIDGVDTSYLHDIKLAGEQLTEHLNDLYSDLEKSGSGNDDVEEEEEEEVVGETPPEGSKTEEE